MLRALLVCAAAVGCFSLAALAHRVPAGRQESDPPRSRTTANQKQRAGQNQDAARKGEVAQGRHHHRLDNIVEAIGMFSGSITMSLEEYNNLKDASRTRTPTQDGQEDSFLLPARRQAGRRLHGFAGALFLLDRASKTTVLLGLAADILSRKGPRRAETIH